LLVLSSHFSIMMSGPAAGVTDAIAVGHEFGESIASLITEVL
jgi:hypothetical protein